jgi:hypothetical protein
MSDGIVLRVTRPIVTITSSMVRAASISEYHKYNNPEQRELREPSRKSFWVNLELNPNGIDALRRAMGKTRSNDLVGTCDSLTVLALTVVMEHVNGIDVLIEESEDTATRFATSFTSDIRMDQKAPPSRDQ